MKFLQELYTVEQVAEMLSVTSRTIRNYLRSGILKGRKLGGQWRFTEEEIRAMFETDSVRNKVEAEMEQEWIDFMKSPVAGPAGEIRVCSCVDVALPQAEVASLCERLYQNLISNDAPLTFRYHYLFQEGIGRFLLIAPPSTIAEAMRILEGR